LVPASAALKEGQQIQRKSVPIIEKISWSVLRK
jgi:hypothetical protein